MSYDWKNRIGFASKSYKCGHCGNSLASNEGYYAMNNRNGQNERYIYICHSCEKPTFFDKDGSQVPGAKFGGDVTNIKDADVQKLYEEVRNCFSANAFTSVAMGCRKMLMHIAVDKGAKERDTYEAYIDYLSDKNYIPEGSKGWVAFLKKMGNKANHKIILVGKEDAEKLLKFTEMLLRVVYEYPASVADEEAK